MKLSNLFKPWTWFRKEEPRKEPEPEEKAESTTDLSRDRSRRKGALNTWIASNMFQKSHDDIKVYNAAGDSFAMDSLSVGMDATDIKSAFSSSSGNLPQILFSWYVQQGFIGYQACAIIAQQWLVNKACKVPGEDAIKNGYELTVNDGSEINPEILTDLRSYDKKYKISRNLKNLSMFSRMFGIRIALFNVKSNDPDYYLKPFNFDGITSGSYKGIAQVDPYWITPELDADAVADPASPFFYEPTWWRISGKRYHRSHLIIIRHSEVADVLKPSYVYGGVPLPQMIYERVYAAERTANEAPQLALTKRTKVIRTDIAKALANQKEFEERIVAFNELQNNYGTLAIDKEEEFNQTDTSLNDLDALIMTQFQLVAAIANMPATKLIETSPKGFNATGEFEMQTYYDLLECIQEDDSELLERHYQLLIRSEIIQKHNIKPFEFDINWKPLKSPSAKEISEINSLNSQTDGALQLAGAIDGEDVRERIIADPNSGYNGLASFEDIEEEIEGEPEGDITKTDETPGSITENRELPRVK